MLKIVSKNFSHALLLSLGLFLKISRWVPLTTPNIVGCYMLHPFAHPVACCYVLLGVVAQSLKPVKLFTVCNLFPAVQYTVKKTHYWKK